MKLYVIKPIRLKRAGRLFDVQPGGIVEIKDPRKAETLIESGHVRPLLQDEAGKPLAARIFSKILDDEIWIVTSPEAVSFVPDGAVVYHPEEIKDLRGAAPEEIRQIHRIKKELGGGLVSVKEIKGIAS